MTVEVSRCPECFLAETIIEIKERYDLAVTEKEKVLLGNKRLCLNCFKVFDRDEIIRGYF